MLEHVGVDENFKGNISFKQTISIYYKIRNLNKMS